MKKIPDFFMALLICVVSRSALADLSVLNDDQLLAKAGDKYQNGELPLGDGRYTLDAPRQGYIYLCHAMRDHGGAQKNGAWIHGNTWNILQKAYVQGQVHWPQAQFSNTVMNNQRVLSGNDLPTNHDTGIFPVQSSDPAFNYDRNPNSIAEQDLRDTLPLNPIYSDSPYCMGGEAGIMLTGVYLFNGFDAGMRDAAAHELQDSCSGHPQVSGQYHYHSLSRCIKDVSERTVIGYALDGFPITGPQMAPGKYLTTDDLDICHGIVSDIIEDGIRKTTYHYVMTQDFPYSVSCFRAKPIRTGPSSGGAPHMHRETHRKSADGPPPEALQACANAGEAERCSFVSPRGVMNGKCNSPPGMPLACQPD